MYNNTIILMKGLVIVWKNYRGKAYQSDSNISLPYTIR